MKVPIRLALWAFAASLLATGCESGEMADPGTHSSGGKASLSSERYSNWSEPVLLGPVNSGFNDQQPALSKDGLTLYFASNRPTDISDNVFDPNIWVTQRVCTSHACPWAAPEVLGPAVNGPFLDVSPTLSRDEHQLFFASQRPNDHCSVTPCDRDFWVSYRENVHDDFGWQPAVSLPGGVNSTEEEVAPSYFENGDEGIPQLFFNRGDIVGDIYVSQMASDGAWGSPTAVTEVNSASADQRPSISHDGLTLYFWSNRDGGVAHIWLATRESVSDPWSAPTLVPSPISDAPTLMPFIHSHGRTETLLFVRPFSPANSRDLWMSERTRSKGSE